MKTRISIFVILASALFLASCKKGNQELYNEVMAVHDEVMPKMEDIHKYKKDFKAEINDTTNITEARKAELEAVIMKLDSAGKGMMVWMREFDPVADSEGEEKAREYLQKEKEKVTKVKKDMLDALEHAKTLKKK